MKLLFITQKLKQQDAFGILWVRAFIAQGYEVEVICLEGDGSSFEFPVHTLGKERGWSRAKSIIEFWRLILTLKYDRVFVHMAPVWYALGWWAWLPKRIPCYLWYTHYKMQLGVWLFGLFGKRYGKKLTELPKDYVNWLLTKCTNLKPDLRAALLAL
jgi:hypothetical protein